jgi:hypothetical protein
MKVITITDEIEAQLIGSQAFIYVDCSSEVLNIENIEFAQEPKSLIISEMKFNSRCSFSSNNQKDLLCQ